MKTINFFTHQCRHNATSAQSVFSVTEISLGLDKITVTIVAIFGLLSTIGVSSAADHFWQQPQSHSVSKQAQASLFGDHDFSASLASDTLRELDGKQSSYSEVSLTQYFSDQSALTFEYAGANDDRNVVLGFTHNDLSVSYLQGSGEDYSSLGGDYMGVDPYLFHGGIKQNFDVQGFALDYGFGRFGHMQYGQATIIANDLEDRRARYMEWSNESLFLRATRFTRGADDIGAGFDVGFAFANKLVAVQALQMENNRSMQRIRLQFEGSKNRQYWMDLSAHQNPLFKANDDYRLMFNFKAVLGTKHLASYQNDEVVEKSAGNGAAIEDEGGTTKKNKSGRGWKRALFIGAGVAAAAGLSSSGSKSQDSSARFRAKNEAARQVLNGINPTSIRENREYGGWVFINRDGSFASTAPVPGEATSVRLPDPALVIPVGSNITASYHTHAAFDPKFDNENFSETDLSANRDNSIDGYLGTPAGQFKIHDVETDVVTTLGTIATQ